MITEEYYKPCSLCHNADCVWMGGKDTHKLCEDFQALSQEPICDRDCEHCTWTECPIEPCDDAISRQAILDGIEELKKSPWATDKRGNGFEYLITEALDVVKDLCIKQAPSVTQKSKTGHWIEYTRVLIPEPINSWEQAWYCSECGYGNQECEDGSAWVEWKYCPNCGAKMERNDKE